MDELKNLSIRNHRGRSKGDFFISKVGNMSPKTRNASVWGSVSSTLVPEEILYNPQFVFSFDTKILQEEQPRNLSAFFKFQKSKFNAFAESAGMEIAFCFGCETSYNCPARLDRNEKSIKEALDNIPESSQGDIGTMVFSMLDKDESFFSFAHIIGKESTFSDVRVNLKAIDTFLAKEYPKATKEELTCRGDSLKHGYLYQYLFRDCFGDVDFTSRNAGLVYNKNTKETTLAPQFDYGEMFNILYLSKMCPPVLTDISTLPDSMKNIPSVVATIEKSNALKLERFNMPAYKLGAESHTFGDDSLKNISIICEKDPSVALKFLTDLRAFKDDQMIGLIVDEAAGTDERQLISDEEKDFVVDYCEGKMDTYEQTLVEGLQKFASKDFNREHEQEIREGVSTLQVHEDLDFEQFEQ